MHIYVYIPPAPDRKQEVAGECSLQKAPGKRKGN